MDYIDLRNVRIEEMNIEETEFKTLTCCEKPDLIFENGCCVCRNCGWSKCDT